MCSKLVISSKDGNGRILAAFLDIALAEVHVYAFTISVQNVQQHNKDCKDSAKHNMIAAVGEDLQMDCDAPGYAIQ